MTPELFLCASVGIALSAACGFRIFVPMLFMAVAFYAGPPDSLPWGLTWLGFLTGRLTEYITLSPGFAWIATPIALKAFAIATVCEIGAYYIPWLDHILDVVATPVSILAGALVMTASMNPFMHWSLTLIAGGAVTGMVQSATVALRAGSTYGTGGIANHVVSTGEAVASTLISIIAIVIPFVIVILVGVFIVYRATRSTRVGERGSPG